MKKLLHMLTKTKRPLSKIKVFHGYDRFFGEISKYPVDISYTRLIDLGEGCDLENMINVLTGAKKGAGATEIGFIIVPQDKGRTHNDAIVVTDPTTDVKTIYIYVEDPTWPMEEVVDE